MKRPSRHALKCGYCEKPRKKLGRKEIPNGDRVPICEDCCKKYFGIGLEGLKEYNRKIGVAANAEFLGFIIIKATLWANELFKDPKKAEQWMVSINSQFQGDSPLQVILRGDSSHVLKFLEERLGRSPGAAF